METRLNTQFTHIASYTRHLETKGFIAKTSARVIGTISAQALALTALLFHTLAFGIRTVQTGFYATRSLIAGPSEITVSKRLIPYLPIVYKKKQSTPAKQIRLKRNSSAQSMKHHIVRSLKSPLIIPYSLLMTLASHPGSRLQTSVTKLFDKPKTPDLATRLRTKLKDLTAKIKTALPKRTNTGKLHQLFQLTEKRLGNLASSHNPLIWLTAKLLTLVTLEVLAVVGLIYHTIATARYATQSAFQTIGRCLRLTKNRPVDLKTRLLKAVRQDHTPFSKTSFHAIRLLESLFLIPIAPLCNTLNFPKPIFHTIPKLTTTHISWPPKKAPKSELKKLIDEILTPPTPKRLITNRHLALGAIITVIAFAAFKIKRATDDLPRFLCSESFQNSSLGPDSPFGTTWATGVLGLHQNDPSQTDIKHAFRHFSRKYHPDKPLGSQHMQLCGTRAYDLLVTKPHQETRDED